ncbi:hypothetical protein [Mongoliitalea daihaiensis]|uniref:hypothetical protein n=1 Tax=Mongoliitalea daihaiensis TaxID=2782006 RepID=UPI001F338CF7|nr:hypothetical protein [Mongoliitalea daihaiensis]UJP64029.1 hypothetical protein IPZ59_14540 [Mongoliitalea daihaiensis]
MEKWEIIDSEGVLYSGKEWEMDTAWDVLTSGDAASYVAKMKAKDEELEEDNLLETFEKWNCDWAGDLKLIKVYAKHS